MGTGTTAVQAFIRFLAFVISMAVLSLILLSTAGKGSEVGFMAILGFNAVVSMIVANMFYILPEWKQMVLLRLGKFNSVRGAGFFIIPPFIYSVASMVDNRIETQQVEATATLTKDNVPTKRNSGGRVQSGRCQESSD